MHRVRAGYRLLWLSFAALVILIVLSPVAFGQESSGQVDQCLTCHTYSTEGKQSAADAAKAFAQSAHGQLACQACHEGQKAVPHPPGQAATEQVCEGCHQTQSNEYRQSVHGQRGIGCQSCHGNIHTFPVSATGNSPVARRQVATTCGRCHEGRVTESYRESFHGKAVALGSSQAATCVSCHGSHNILGPADPRSAVAKANVPQTCAKCHREANANFAAGQEHFELAPEGSGLPMYYTFKFFTWLTILTITLLIIHMELELWRRLRDLRRG